MLRNSPLLDEARNRAQTMPQAALQPYANPHLAQSSPQAHQAPLQQMRDYRSPQQKRLLDYRERTLSLPHPQPLDRSRVGSIHGALNPNNAPIPQGLDQQGQIGGPEQGQIGVMPPNSPRMPPYLKPNVYATNPTQPQSTTQDNLSRQPSLGPYPASPQGGVNAGPYTQSPASIHTLAGRNEQTRLPGSRQAAALERANQPNQVDAYFGRRTLTNPQALGLPSKAHHPDYAPGQTGMTSASYGPMAGYRGPQLEQRRRLSPL
jgi:hypothetical protein